MKKIIKKITIKILQVIIFMFIAPPAITIFIYGKLKNLFNRGK